MSDDRSFPSPPGRGDRGEEIDCDQAVEQLYSYLDEELTPDVQKAIHAHLKECADCFGHFEFERAFLRFLEARCRAEGAPPDLCKRIIDGLLPDQDRNPQ
jgi:anti-sigma factor (TIGR02949 family)